MTLAEFMAGKPHGTLAELARAARMSYTAVHRALNGKPLKMYEKAKALSDATGGAVTVKELCEPVIAKKRRGRAKSGAAA
jgi:hypothetical protein